MVQFNNESPISGKTLKMGNLNRQNQSIHEGKTYQCLVCEQKFKYKGHLKTHIQSIHEGKSYQCPICEQK